MYQLKATQLGQAVAGSLFAVRFKLHVGRFGSHTLTAKRRGFGEMNENHLCAEKKSYAPPGEERGFRMNCMVVTWTPFTSE